MNLEQIQRAMFHAVQQPLTRAERMQRNDATAIADEMIKPNDRLTSFERLEIYNRQYWFRILSALADDFPGLQAVLGEDAFEKLSVAYLRECPSESLTLRNLGSRLEKWLRANPDFAGKRLAIALDVIRLEWAETEAFDLEQLPKLSQEDLANAGDDPVFLLQPYIRLLELEHPVDDWLVELKHGNEDDHDIASNAFEEMPEQRRRTRPPLPRRKRTYVAVHRHQEDLAVYFKRIDREAYLMLTAMREGKSLSQSIEAAVTPSASAEKIAAQLHDWFANGASLGWFCKL